jgi:hypothetical protein
MDWEAFNFIRTQPATGVDITYDITKAINKAGNPVFLAPKVIDNS